MRTAIGDIIEIPTGLGLAYAQLTHKHPKWGALIRIIDGFFESRPTNLDDLVAGSTRFAVFFPLGPALSRQIFKRIGNAPVPAGDAKFPTFKAGIPHPVTKKWVVIGGSGTERKSGGSGLFPRSNSNSLLAQS